MLLKKVNSKLLFLILAVIFAAGCAAGVYWFNGQKDGLSYVALLDGERIELNEYKIYLYLQKMRFESLGGEDIWEMDFDGQTGENLAKQSALDNVVYIKISRWEAERQNLVLSEDERELCGSLAEEYYNNASQDLGGGVGILDWKKVNEDYLLYRKLYESITGSFVPDMEDFAYYFQQYYEDYRHSLVEVDAQVIRVEPQALSEAQEIYRKAAAIDNISEEDFEAVAALYPNQGSVSEGNAVHSYTASAVIREDIFPEEVVEAAYALGPGELSSLITTSRGHYLLRIKSVTEPDLQALKEEQLEAYTILKKNEIFAQDYKKWARDAEVVKNQKVWDGLRI